jgi:hypothetical protein
VVLDRVPAARFLLPQVDGIALQSVTLSDPDATGTATASVGEASALAAAPGRHAGLIRTIFEADRAPQLDEREVKAYARELCPYLGERAPELIVPGSVHGVSRCG